MPDAAVPAGHVQSVSVVHEALRQNPPEQTSPLAQFAFDPQVPLQLFGAPPTGAVEGEGLGDTDGDDDADGEGEAEGDGLGEADGEGETTGEGDGLGEGLAGTEAMLKVRVHWLAGCWAGAGFGAVGAIALCLDSYNFHAPKRAVPPKTTVAIITIKDFLFISY
ncbi:MAG: hypothetical protein A3A58_01815 [Candidatus Blackburnbacteria bacterium RIFCSPLOWO2_01_FULL_41_27]|uniref:Uncharacterized protein n=2 Tax=Candidatus Blackburniibacteriota TaxID=1817898 RepID=A0A1G1V4H7_9BACT|nr:MAG: hypothetical protein A3F61_02090 [Candidatus Blackburnbacteria bacterium RIFCSPHIGHO2_12_FULL_41_13b]OGY13492.1 MAG: hypothetical protein A3A58_01815 [Candidatus Blackburnbacteria bacterium RIFCSPLOWO2_01_FULL_41_27]